MKEGILSKITVLLLLTLLVASSCGSRKRVAKPTENLSTVDNSIRSFEMSNLSFHTLSGRAKAKISLGNKNHDVTANIRIDYDKKIWISVTALLGIEVARILITPDSIKIINRLQSEYIAKPFSYIYQFTNPGITFKTLQDILLGNTSPELLRTDNVQLASSEDEIFIVGVKNRLAFQYGMNKLQRPHALKLDDASTRQQLEVTYDQYGDMNGYVFPQRFAIKVTGEEVALNANLEYNRVQFDEVIDFPFTVPPRYQVVK